MSFLKHISGVADFDTLLTNKASGLVVVDFYATWCPPCHAIAPVFAKLSNEYRHVAFAKVDVDAQKELSERYNVSAMPTFIFIKNRQVVDTIKGADPSGLENLVKKHAPPAPDPTTFQENEASGSKDESIMAGDVSLLEFLDSTQVNCLNEATGHTLKGILSGKAKNKSSLYLESDADEQLLLNIHFNQTVKVRTLILHAKDPSGGPKTIKLFINKPSLGFEDVEDAQEPEAAQVLELEEPVLKDGRGIALRYVRYQSVNSLHIFVASNHGGKDETRIDAIDIFGLPVETTRMGNLRKPADHES